MTEEEGWGSDPDEAQAQNNVELDVDTQIENMIVEGEACMDTKVDEAISFFQTACELENTQKQGEYKYQFQAVKHMTVLYGKKGDDKTTLSKLGHLLKLCKKVAPNEARDTLNYVLDQLTKSLPPAAMEGIYEEVVKSLKSDNEKLWQTVCIRLCRIFLDKKKYKPLDDLAEQLKASMRGPSGAYDEMKGNPFEILALQMQMLAEIKEIKKLKILHNEAMDLSGVVTDARVNAMLKECGALIYLGEKNWEKAQADLLESFKSYQQLANSKAKLMLKLLLVISMVSGSEINPMTLAEAKVYQDDPEIGPLANLRAAYEDNKISQLKNIMQTKGKKLAEDKELGEYSADFFKAIKQKILMEKISSYTNVSLSFLAKDLGVSESEVKALLVELILDQKIEGKIDESKATLEVKQSEKDVLETKRYVALERMANTMATMYTGIIDSVCT